MAVSYELVIEVGGQEYRVDERALARAILRGRLRSARLEGKRRLVRFFCEALARAGGPPRIGWRSGFQTDVEFRRGR